MIIAIDGPAGAGKSTIARRVGQELGLFFLDTGAMYRCVALEVLRGGVDPEDQEAVADVASAIELHFDAEGNITIDGQSAAKAIRSDAVEGIVSVVAANSLVRRAIVPKQKLIAKEQGGVVAEGRDMTTVVFADSKHRFYLDASVAERARRRAAERGTPELAEKIQASLEARDSIDSGRADSPLHLADGVRHIDTDSLSAEEVISVILGFVRAEVG
jgi:cytidylate kinase